MRRPTADCFQAISERESLFEGVRVKRSLKEAHEEKTCLDSVPIVGPFICPDPKVATKTAEKFCDFGEQNDEGLVWGDQMETIDSIIRTLRRQLVLTMHYKAVEEPLFEGTQALSEIKTRIESSMNYFEMVIATFKGSISTLMIISLQYVRSYGLIAHGTVKMISDYLTNIEFKNNFITSYFWSIDCKRQLHGKPHLAPITNAEKKRNGLISPFGFQTRVEMKQCWMPLLKWAIVVVVVTATLLVEYYVYRILRRVKDEGPIAELLKEILNFNYTRTFDWDVDNDACASQARAPNWNHTATWILGPLFVMFMMQVVFSFVIERMTLFLVVGYIFHKRSKAHIVHLYNKLLLARMNERRLARARIRCAVERRLLRRAKDGGVMREESFLRRRIIDVLFKTGKCLLCGVKFRTRSLVNCNERTATYCRTCYEEDLTNQCYACLAEEDSLNFVRLIYVAAYNFC